MMMIYKSASASLHRPHKKVTVLSVDTVIFLVIKMRAADMWWKVNSIVRTG